MEAGMLAEMISQNPMAVVGGKRNSRLLQVCYCPKHAHMSRDDSTPPPSDNLAPRIDTARLDQPAPAAEGHENQKPEQPTARCQPFNHAVRRGMRAPEALENALAKRRFMQQTPYLVRQASYTHVYLDTAPPPPPFG